uniref:RRM Nup35-type domain-containing protein n=1 Tax=Lotharella globosa TaxID=91324 RepID=A0A7S3Z7U6_9EUKA
MDTKNTQFYSPHDMHNTGGKENHTPNLTPGLRTPYSPASHDVPPMESLSESIASVPNSASLSKRYDSKVGFTPTPQGRRGQGTIFGESEYPSLPNRRYESRSHTMAAATGNAAFTVRVFGFPANKAQAVLAEFQNLGAIIRTTNGSGNWMDIEFNSPIIAKSAESMDGSVIDGVMIGVKMIGSWNRGTPYRDDSLTNKRKKGVNQIAKEVEQSLMNIDVTGAFNNIFGVGSGGTRYGDRNTAGNLVPQNTCSKILEYILQW